MISFTGTAIVGWPWVSRKYVAKRVTRPDDMHSCATELLNTVTQQNGAEQFEVDRTDIFWWRRRFCLFLKKILVQLRRFRPGMHPVARVSEIVCPEAADNYACMDDSACKRKTGSQLTRWTKRVRTLRIIHDSDRAHGPDGRRHGKKTRWFNVAAYFEQG